MNGLPAGKVAVLSPHLDDAVLALGAAISRAAREGARIRIVTVFAGDVESELPASRWDALGGFATEGEAARARRAEDAAACAIVGAEPHQLSFSDYPYVTGRDPELVLAAVSAAVAGCDALLLPGFPLVHADHRFLAESLQPGRLPVDAVALYAEQPYRFRLLWQRLPAIDPALRVVVPDEPQWQGVEVGAEDRAAKRRAVRAYRSQLPLLGLGRVRLAAMLAHEALRGGEAIAWLGPAPQLPSATR